MHARLLLCLLLLPLAGCYGPHGESFDSDGARLAYYEAGDGPPLILVHGFQGTAHVHWRLPGTIDALAESFRVIAVDCRGHGRSDKPEDSSAYGRTMVEDIARLMDHLDIESANIAGYSMGAWITLQFAATYPERVDAVAVGGGGWNDWDKQLAQVANDIAVAFIHRGYRPAAFAACSAAFPELELTQAQVDALPLPLLGVVGSEDFALPDLERLGAAVPEMELVIIEGTTHNSTLFAPEFQAALVEFFTAP